MNREDAIALAIEMAKICRISFCVMAQISDDDGFKYYYAPNMQFDRFQFRYIEWGYVKSGIVNKAGVFRNLTYEENYARNKILKALPIKQKSKRIRNAQV